MNYKNIPKEDWSIYPETKPKESGYYLTVYEDINLYYKCINWCNKRTLEELSYGCPVGAFLLLK